MHVDAIMRKKGEKGTEGFEVKRSVDDSTMRHGDISAIKQNEMADGTHRILLHQGGESPICCELCFCDASRSVLKGKGVGERKRERRVGCRERLEGGRGRRTGESREREMGDAQDAKRGDQNGVLLSIFGLIKQEVYYS